MATATKATPATYKKIDNEYYLSILVNNSGINAAWDFNASAFVRDPANDYVSETDLHEKMNAHLRALGKRTIEERAATLATQRQTEVFQSYIWKKAKEGKPLTAREQDTLLAQCFDPATVLHYVTQLFVARTYRGFYMEELAQEAIQPHLPEGAKIWVDYQKLDVGYAVDFCLHRGRKILLPVQVKPKSFTTMYQHSNKTKDEIKMENFKRDHGHEVKILEYDGQNQWVNMDYIMSLITTD